MEIYEEKLAFPFFNILFLIFIAITGYFTYLAFIQLLSAPLSYHQEPLWLNLSMGVFFCFITFIVYQFRRLNVLLTHDKLEVSYGFFKHSILRIDIEDAYIDLLNPLFAYGGWGIRMGKHKGKSRLVYNIPGKKNIIISLKNSKREFVFSLNSPEHLMLVLKS
jgi:hypothetical protein